MPRAGGVAAESGDDDGRVIDARRVGRRRRRSTDAPAARTTRTPRSTAATSRHDRSVVHKTRLLEDLPRDREQGVTVITRRPTYLT